MKMKNKKILSRVLSLVGVAVLMFALAVPCFAYAPASVLQETVSYTFTDVASFKDFVYSVEDYTHIERIVFRDDTFGEVTLNDVGIRVGEYTLFVASNYNVVYADADGSTDTLVTSLRWTDEIPDSLTLVQGMMYYFDDGSMTVSNDLTLVVTDASTFSITVYWLQDFQGTATTKSGLYGQLYNIIADAMFGDGAVLDGTQDFALSLVVTLLVLATVLLPVLLVLGIMFRAFRW